MTLSHGGGIQISRGRIYWIGSLGSRSCQGRSECAAGGISQIHWVSGIAVACIRDHSMFYLPEYPRYSLHCVVLVYLVPVNKVVDKRYRSRLTAACRFVALIPNFHCRPFPPRVHLVVWIVYYLTTYIYRIEAFRRPPADNGLCIHPPHRPA